MKSLYNILYFVVCELYKYIAIQKAAYLQRFYTKLIAQKLRVVFHSYLCLLMVNVRLQILFIQPGFFTEIFFNQNLY